MTCQLPYHSSQKNLTSFLEEVGAIGSSGNEILDLDLFREVIKQIENDLNNSYGIQASPFIEDDLTGSQTFYTNDKVFERIDEVRKELGLYEDRIAGSYVQGETEFIPPNEHISYKMKVIQALESSNVRERDLTDIMFQKTPVTNKEITPEFYQTLVNFVKKVNPDFRVEVIDDLLASKGVYGLIDFKNFLIQLNQGNQSAMAEETAHVFFELMEDSNPIKQRMMDDITHTRIFKQVRNDPNYKKAYGNDVNLLKREAVAKLLSLYLTDKDLAKKMSGSDELWGNLVRSFNDFLRWIQGKQKSFSEFLEAAERIINLDTSGLHLDRAYVLDEMYSLEDYIEKTKTLESVNNQKLEGLEQIYFNLNDTLFDYKRYPQKNRKIFFDEKFAAERDKYYQNVKLTSLGRELRDKIRYIGENKVTIYTSMTTTPALETRIKNEFGNVRLERVNVTQLIEDAEGNIIKEEQVNSLQDLLDRDDKKRILIVDNGKPTLKKPYNLVQYNSKKSDYTPLDERMDREREREKRVEITEKFLNELERVNQRKDGSVTRQILNTWELITREVKDIEKMERAMQKQGEEEVSKIFRDKYGNLGLPMKPITAAKKLLEETNKYRDSLLQFYSTLEATTGFFKERNDGEYQSIKDLIETGEMENIEKAIYELSKITKIGTNWQQNIKEFRQVIKDVPNTETVDSLLGELETQIQKTKDLAHDLNIKVLSEKFSNEFEAYNWNKRARRKELEELFEAAQDPIEKEKYKKEIDELSEKGPEQISRILMGEVTDIDSLTVWVKTLPDSRDPLVGSIGKLLKKAFAQVEVSEVQRAQDMGAKIEDIKREHNLSDKDLEELLVVEKTPVYNPETEQHELKDRYAFLNPWRNRHEHDEQKKPYLDTKDKYITAKENKDPELESIRKEYLEQRRIFEEWETTNWHRPYTEEYYKRYDELRNSNPELFEELKVAQDLIWSDINSKSLLLRAETNPTQKKILREDIDTKRRELAQLRSETYFDGTLKVDKDLALSVVAKEKTRIDNEIHEWSVDFKSFNADFTIFLNTLNIEDFAKETYLALLAEDGQSYSKLYNQIKNDAQYELVEWMDENTIIRYSQDWYEKRGRVTEEISMLSDELSQEYGEEKGEYKETWESLMNLSSPYRDEDRILDGSVTPPNVQEKVLEYEKKIERIKRQVSKERQGTYSPKIKVLKNQLSQKIQELHEIQNKQTTEAYNDTFVELANETGFSEEFNRLHPELYFNYSSNLNLLIDTEEFQDFLDSKPDSLFTEWYRRNHLTKSYKDSFGVEYQTETPTYIWYKIEPSNSDEILTVPSYQYSQRVVKEEYKTEKENWTTWNPLTNRWLPKSENYFNPAYRRLQQSQDSRSKGLYKALRTLLDYHLKTQEGSPQEARLEFGIPYVSKRPLEMAGNVVKNMANSFFDRDNRFEQGEGNFDETVTDEPKKGLKSRFISWLNDVVEGKQKDNNSVDNVRKYTRVAVPYSHHIGIERVSKDIMLTATMFGISTNKATRMLHTLPTFQILEDVLQNSNLQLDEKGRPVSNNDNRLKAIQFQRDHFIYGVNKRYEIPGQWGRSIDRGLNMVRKLNTVGSLGWPFGIANTLKNNLQGRLQNIIGQRFGDWSSPKSMRKASLNINTNFWKFLSEIERPVDKRSRDFHIITFFNPHLFNNIAETLHKGGTSRIIQDRHIMIMNESMEFAISTNLLYSHLYHVKVKKGDEVKELYDVLKAEGNSLKIEEGWIEYKTGRPLNEEYLIDTKLALQTASQYVQGKVGDKTLLGTYTIGQAVLYFKNWLIPMLRRRFDSKKENYMIGGDIEGYWRTFGRLSIKMLRDLLTHGKTYWHTFTPEEKRNYLTTVNEMIFVVVSSMLIALVFGFDADDPDKFKKLKDNSYAENMALLIAIQAKAETEMLSAMPFWNVEDQFIPPVLTELPKVIMNPTIGFGVINDAIKTVNAGYGLAIRDDSAYYDRNQPAYNIEKGDAKVNHYLMKTLQIDNIIYSSENPEGKLQIVLGMMKR